MNNQRTLMGFTFSQLHGAMTNKELTAAVIAFSMNQLRQNPDFIKSAGDHAEELIQIAQQEAATMMEGMPTATMWDHMRDVYDSEKKFNDAIDMMVEMGNMSVIMGKTMGRVFERLMQMKEDEQAAALH